MGLTQALTHVKSYFLITVKRMYGHLQTFLNKALPWVKNNALSIIKFKLIRLKRHFHTSAYFSLQQTDKRRHLFVFLIGFIL